MKPTDTPFDVNLENENIQQTGVCEASGDEHGSNGFAALSGDDHEFDAVNKGCYGVNREYYCPLANTNTTYSGKCFAGMVSRNIGAKYWGAAFVSDPEQSKTGVKKIPVTSTEDPLDPGKAFDFLTGMPQGAIVIAPEGTDEIAIRVANAGGAATPFNLILANEFVLAELPEEPGDG